MPGIILTGSAGRLEARYHHSKHPDAPLAIVLHPDPMQGGTMNNRVTVTLYNTFIENGFSVVRFNYRGVGKSEADQNVDDFEEEPQIKTKADSKGGKLRGREEGDLNDSVAVLEWIQSINPGQRPIWIAGFSYGALMGMQLLMRRPEIVGFISICPPVNVYDFSFLAPCPTSGMVINGDKDVFCPLEPVNKLVDKLNNQKGVSIDFRVIPNCDHAFTGHLEDISKYVTEYITLKSDQQAAFA